MRIFAQKPKVSQPTKSAKSTIFAPSNFGHSGAVNAILHSHRAIGDTAQRQQEADTATGEGQTTTETAGVGFDFSRIRLHAPAPTKLQTKLALGAPGDIYEQEADRVAGEVMRMPEPRPAPHAAFPSAETHQVQDAVGGGVPASSPQPDTGDVVGQQKTPKVTGWAFYASGGFSSTECLGKAVQLGPNTDNFYFGVELRALINEASDAEYDIKQTIERSVWQKIGGAWQLWDCVGPGEEDKISPDMKCVQPTGRPPQQRYLSLIDSPGIKRTASFDPAATEWVYKATFAVSVHITIGGTTFVDPNTFYWHSITWLTKFADIWLRDEKLSDTAPGTVIVGTAAP